MSTVNTLSVSSASFHSYDDYIYTSVCVCILTFTYAFICGGGERVEGKINSLLEIFLTTTTNFLGELFPFLCDLVFEIKTK